MTFDAAIFQVWRVRGLPPRWYVMVFNHLTKLYATLQTSDPKIVAQANRAKERFYPLSLTVSGKYPDKLITKAESLEPQDNDYIPDL